MLSRFHRLERLSLYNVDTEYIENILLRLTSLSFLSSLTIIGIDCRKNDHLPYRAEIRNVICHQIFRLSALKYCNLSLKGVFANNPLPVATNEYNSIEHLVIDNVIYITEFNSLLSYVPQIRRLDVHSLQQNVLRRLKEASPELKHITHVSLKLIRHDMNVVEQLIINLFSKIEVFRILIEYGCDTAYRNNERWKRLILSHMPNLRIFDIQHNNWPIHANNIAYKNNLSVSDAEINPFTSSFWIERQWFFDYQCYQSQKRDYIFFYSTNPYRRINYILFEPSKGKRCLNSHKTDVKSVHHVNIQSGKGLMNCTDYFPNATELTLGDKFTRQRDLVFTNLHNIISFKQLTKLNIKLPNFAFMKIIELLCLIPNIHILELPSISLYGNSIETIKQNESFRLLSNLNTITVVTISHLCTVDNIQLIIDLCPRMQHLAFHTLTKNFQPIARFLLETTRHNAHPLNSLCFLGAGELRHRKINALIQSETLLNDYMLKQSGDSLYLWW